MKKRILSCLMALALCLTLLPMAALAEETEGTAQTPPAVEKAADPANGEVKQESQPAETKQEGQPAEAKQENQSAEAKQESQLAEVKQENQPAEAKQENQPTEAKQENQPAEAKQESQPAEQEEQQEDSAAKQAVAAVQAMIDALPDAAELDGMDDAEAMEAYEAFQTACEAYYDTLSEKQQAQLKNTEKLAALSERFSQLETLAAGEHQDHRVCGKSGCTETGHDEITFDKWLASSTSSGKRELRVGGNGSSSEIYGDPLTAESGKYVLDGGNYYLKTGVDGFDSDVTIEHPIQIKGDVTICLNGQTIQSKAKDQPVFEVVSGSLTLTDCKNNNKGAVTHCFGGTGSGVEVNGGEFNLYGGSITKNTAAKGGGVKVTSGTVNMYGGEITDNTAAGSAEGTGNGGGVYMSGGTFHMRGGSITDNTTEVYGSGEGNGGGVYVYEGTFTMSGGTISGNTANSTNGADGGVGVYNNATFNMSGGEITGNEALSYSGGVGVHSGGTFIMSGGTIGGTNASDANNAKYGGGVNVDQHGKFEMSGGAKISGNKATENGGGVYASGGTFNMNGDASIIKNEASQNGGGVYVLNGTFNMNGNASVRGNTANVGGGVHVSGVGKFNMNGDASITGNIGNGVHFNGTGTFTVSGKPTVTGNTRKNADSNVYLAGSNTTITIGAYGLDDSPNSIGVTKNPAGVDSVIATGANKNYSGNFFVDNNEYKVGYDETEKKLVLAEKDTPAETHTHCLCGKTHTAIGGHKTDTQITFDTKLWMDNGVLKKGNGDWTKGTVNRADGGAVSHEGYVLTTGNYYLDDNLTLNGAAILIDGDVKLCLNGHTIDRANGNAARDYVIWVLGKNKAHLTLTDCVGGGTIKGGGNGGVDIFGFCTLDMFGGTITGNTNSGVDVGQFGEFNMYGGKITGNSAGFGGGVYTYGKFTMSGGSITNNTATEKGGGVLVGGGTFTVSGNVNITNNKVNNERNNVYLSKADKTVIGVTGPLTGGARIGVTPETWPVGNGQAAIASGVSAATGGTHYNMTSADMNCFQSDNGEYQISLASNVVLLAKKGGETPEIVPVSGVALNTTTATLEVGKTTTLTAMVTPENATNKSVTWTSSNENVATVDAYGTVTAVKAGTATITATAEGGTGKFATCTVTVTGGTTPSQPSNPGGSTGGNTGGGGGSSSDRDSSDSNPVIKTETKNNADGSTTKTETRRDGSVTQTTTGKDGSVSKTETKPNGSSVTENKAADGSTGTVKTDKNGQTTAETKVSAKAVEDAKKNGEAVKAPVEVEASRNSGTAPTVKVELPKGAGETKVEIPVSNVKPGTVAVLVHPDGTEEIVKNSIPTEDGIQLTVDGNATVKIVDNSKGFIDTRNHWAEDAIDFVSARGLVNGMSATIYAPNNSTTRAQLWTILARQNDADLSGGNTWYESAQNWAKDKGVSDGANPNAAINRAQMVTMLWRAVGQPAPATAAMFTDVSADAYYAGAVSWAVENGITTGVGGGKFDPTGACTRAQIAAFLTRLYAGK